MTAEDAFNDYYNTEGVRYYEDPTHQGFMRHAFLHGWAASRAKDLETIVGGMSPVDMKSIGVYLSALHGGVI